MLRRPLCAALRASELRRRHRGDDRGRGGNRGSGEDRLGQHRPGTLGAGGDVSRGDRGRDDRRRRALRRGRRGEVLLLAEEGRGEQQLLGPLDHRAEVEEGGDAAVGPAAQVLPC